MVSLLDIRSIFKGTIKLGEPLAHYTSLGIGGPADYLFAPSSREDLISVVTRLRASGIPFLFAGRGSNLLVSDQGYHGAVIDLERDFCALRLERGGSGGALVYADPGARLAALVDFCIAHALQGVESLTGMPGTVGGLVTGGGLAAGLLARVEILQASGIGVVSEAPADFSYRRTGSGRDVVLGTVFRLEQGDKEQLMRIRRQTLVRRNAERPLNVPRAGIMFRDPPGRSAAECVEHAGMKGTRRGSVAVSERDANMLLNLGKGAAVDALGLLREVQRAVRDKLGVQLALALRLAGFEEELVREVA
jgi:UDP-N-acetylmuramate dehydrogenase